MTMKREELFLKQESFDTLYTWQTQFSEGVVCSGVEKRNAGEDTKQIGKLFASVHALGPAVCCMGPQHERV